MIYWITQAFKNTLDFNGRARRKEYWFFQLGLILAYMSLIILAVIFSGGNDPNSTDYEPSPALGGFMIIYMLLALGTFLTNLSVTVRRLHDTGRSGWNLLFGMIPLVGGFIVLFFMIQDSQPGENAWGPNPKEGETFEDKINSIGQV